MTAAPIVALTDADTLSRAIATILVARGFRVAVYHVETMRLHAEALVEEHGADRVFTHVIEIGAWETLDIALAATKAVFGVPAHAVVHFDRWDAGGGGPLHAGRDDHGLYHRMMAGNTEAVYRAMRVFLPPMVEAGAGSVVVLGSRMAAVPREAPGAAVYAASKAAAVALACTAAEEVREHGVRVNAILLNIVDSPEARAGMPDFDRSKWVSPDSVARAVGFLISDDARDITGAMIPMYGRS